MSISYSSYCQPVIYLSTQQFIYIPFMHPSICPPINSPIFLSVHLVVSFPLAPRVAPSAAGASAAAFARVPDARPSTCASASQDVPRPPPALRRLHSSSRDGAERGSGACRAGAAHARSPSRGLGLQYQPLVHPTLPVTPEDRLAPSPGSSSRRALL